jgi:hypothetical protein
MCLHESIERSGYKNEDITGLKYLSYNSLSLRVKIWIWFFSVSLNLHFLLWIPVDNIYLYHSEILDIKYLCTMDPAAGS